jgi:hypothetical protein
VLFVFFKTEEICQHLRRNVNGFKETCADNSFSNLTSFALCGKMAVLHKLVTALLKKNDKILIFSHSTKVFNLFGSYFPTLRNYIKISYKRALERNVTALLVDVRKRFSTLLRYQNSKKKFCSNVTINLNLKFQDCNL